MLYTIYNFADGRIVRSVTCREEDIGLQFDAATQGALAGRYDDDCNYIENGSVVAMPPRPSDVHAFDYATKQWVDPRTLDQIKLEQWTAIKVARAVELTTPLTTPFGPFDATDAGQKSITDAVLLLQTMEQLGTPTTIDFTLANNTTATLTTAQMVQVGLLLGQRTQQIYGHGRLRRDAIAAATTAAEVEAVVW